MEQRGQGPLPYLQFWLALFWLKVVKDTYSFTNFNAAEFMQ